MISMPTIAVSKETQAELMRRKSERIRSGKRTTYDQIISKLLKLEAQVTDELPKEVEEEIQAIKKRLRNGSITKDEITISQLMELGYPESIAHRVYKRLMKE